MCTASESRWPGRSLVLAIIVAAGLAACSSAPDAEPGSTAGSTPASTPRVPGAATAAPSAPALGTAVGTGDNRAGISIEIKTLKRDSPTTATLTGTLANGGDSRFDYLFISVRDGTYNLPSASGVTLIDPVARLRYFPLRDTEGTCVCTPFSIGTRLPPGARVDLTVSFPAPPEGVETVTVDWEGFNPVAGVPLS